jgi:hypothetical protein
VDRITKLTDRIGRFQGEVAGNVHEPWRSGLLAIALQLQLGIEAFLALRTATANDVVATAERLTKAQMTNARRTVLPVKPDDVSEAALFDRKADIIRLLDGQPLGEGLTDCILTLSWEAQRDGDDLTTFCLASGPLDFYYRARQLNVVHMRERILRLRGGSLVAQLLDRFSGPDGIATLVLETKEVLLDPSVVEAVQQALLRPKLDLKDATDEELTPEERQEIEAIEREFRQVAAIASDLDGPEVSHRSEY